MSEVDNIDKSTSLIQKEGLVKAFRKLINFNSDSRNQHGNITIEPLSSYQEWNSEHPCFQCGGGCCHDMSIQLFDVGYTSDDIKFGALKPFVQNPEKSIDRELAEEKKEGVFYTHSKKGISLLTIRGNCPGLNEDGGCKFHDQPRPQGCSKVTYGDQICMHRRQEKGLSLIPDNKSA